MESTTSADIDYSAMNTLEKLREHQECMSEEDAMLASDELANPVFASADAREGMRAFKEKRKANFTGK